MDAYFFDSADGGDIECLNGVITLDEGLYAMAYLCLQGGNEDDDGSDGALPLQWWGNLTDTNESRHLRSQFQAAVLNNPLNSATLQIFEEAATADLNVMVEEELVESFTVEARIAAPKRLALECQFAVRDDVFPLTLEFLTR